MIPAVYPFHTKLARICNHIHCTVHNYYYPSTYLQSARRPQFSCPRGSESHTRKLRLYYGDFVQENFNMADKTAGKLETALCVNKASEKVFEPKTS